ncbi:MAG TPA: hypothetical protein VE669_11185, partial [Actinomycetota bacterium]|nr:hypothetical protein [Actinomycetota bacterium]
MREVLSTARPTPLRLAGFLAIVLGAAAAAFGATRDWAVIGFPQDRTGAADVVFRGIDVWEGKTVLLVAIAALIAMIALRLVRVAGTRKLVATLLIAFGLLAGALPLADAVRATDRFGGGEGLERMVTGLAAELELP